MAGNGYDDTPILFDDHGRPIPVYYNSTTKLFLPWSGPDANGPLVQDSVSKAVQDSILAKLSADPASESGLTDFAVGSKTVGAAEVALFAGVAALANRRRMRLLVEGTLPIYIGKTGVLTTTGFPIWPGQLFPIEFNPGTATAVYGIAASNQTVWILEEA